MCMLLYWVLSTVMLVFSIKSEPSKFIQTVMTKTYALHQNIQVYKDECECDFMHHHFLGLQFTEMLNSNAPGDQTAVLLRISERTQQVSSHHIYVLPYTQQGGGASVCGSSNLTCFCIFLHVMLPQAQARW